MKCPYCQSENTVLYYNAEMPNILSACPDTMLDNVKVFPLTAELCKNCLLGFNSSRLDEEELKRLYDNYLYISPLHGIGASKYNGMIATLKNYFEKEDKIIEIGCSEGYLLKALYDDGYTNLIGLEPGPQADIAKKMGLNVIKEYFNEYTFPNKSFDGFYLMHVFEHFSDPFSILRSLKAKLSSKGKIVIEVPYFSGYHHQHLFFYNKSFMKKLCKGMGLKVVEAIIEFDSLRVVLVHEDNYDFSEFTCDEKGEEIIEFSNSQLKKFNEKILSLNMIFKDNAGKKVFWWGAGSSSVIYLNQIKKNIFEEVELIIVDGDKNKQGNFIPGLNIKVNSYEIMKNRKVELVIIASEFYKEIQDNMKESGINPDKTEVFIGI